MLFLGAWSLLLASCIGLPARAPGVGAPVAWDALPGWVEERPAAAWPALLHTCKRMSARDPRWKELCVDAALFPDPDENTARAFFETRFQPRAVRNDSGGHDGLVTGYYEPLLEGSRAPSERFRYPIYQRPDDLLVEIFRAHPASVPPHLRDYFNVDKLASALLAHLVEVAGVAEAPGNLTILVVESR